MPDLSFDPLIAAAVLVATALTDAIYVMFTNAVVRRKRFPAAAWSSIWYMLSSFAVIRKQDCYSAFILESAMGKRRRQTPNSK